MKIWTHLYTDFIDRKLECKSLQTNAANSLCFLMYIYKLSFLNQSVKMSLIDSQIIIMIFLYFFFFFFSFFFRLNFWEKWIVEISIPSKNGSFLFNFTQNHCLTNSFYVFLFFWFFEQLIHYQVIVIKPQEVKRIKLEKGIQAA